MDWALGTGYRGLSALKRIVGVCISASVSSTRMLEPAGNGHLHGGCNVAAGIY